MNETIIEERLESLLTAAEHQAGVCFRNVVAEAAGRGALQNGAVLLMKAACVGDALDTLAASGLADVAAIEAKGGDTSILYESLTTKLVQLKLRGVEKIVAKSDWARGSAEVGMRAEVERRLTIARNRVRHHQLGFDRSAAAAPAAAGNVSISGSQGVIVQTHSPGATATLSIDVERVAAAVDALDAATPWHQLATTEANELRAELATIKAQLGKTSPSAFIIRESVRTARSLVENIAASVATPHVLAAAVNLWAASGLG